MAGSKAAGTEEGPGGGTQLTPMAAEKQQEKGEAKDKNAAFQVTAQRPPQPAPLCSRQLHS